MLQEIFGAEVAHRERIESDGVEEALIKVADSYVQLLTPVRTPRRWRSSSKGGEGMHHVGYRVADCAAALQAVRTPAAPSSTRRPRPGSRGTTVAFVHPKGAFGVLTELVQE